MEKDSSSDTGDSDLAQEVYQQNNCLGCHGGDLEGGSGPALTNFGDTLSNEEIHTTIEEGGGRVPEDLFEDEAELAALVGRLS